MKKIFPESVVIGTDIGYDRDEFDNSIVTCNFNDLPRHLVDFDMIYTNALDHSLDHSLDPAEAIIHWSTRLKPAGMMVIAFPVGVPATSTDPVSFSCSLSVRKMCEAVNLMIARDEKAEGVIHVIHARKHK